jgi:hypothetical protein
LTTEQFFDLSLDPEYAVVWHDEDEFPNEKYKEGQTNFIHRDCFQIKTEKWRSGRRLFSAGNRLEVKGV